MNKNNIKLKAAAAAAVFLAFSLVLLYLLQALLVPKYMTEIQEGAMIAEYYDSESRHQVLFFGDCEFYNAINPCVIWEEYGISSYVRGSAQQLIWQSYYLMLESFEYEKPDIVVFNAVELLIGKTKNETYTRMTLDGMPLSRYKLEAAKVSMECKEDEDEEESLASYIFPILRFHSRWSELTGEDFEYLFRRDKVTYNGYMMTTGTEAKTKFRDLNRIPNEIPDNCWDWLDKIREACEENGVELIILKSPTDSRVYPWYDEWEEQLDAYSAKYGVRYINAIEEEAAIGTDWQTDSCDGGDHLNWRGAAKLSSYLGKIFSTEYELENLSQDKELAEEWNPLCEQYKAAAEAAEKGN